MKIDPAFLRSLESTSSVDARGAGEGFADALKTAVESADKLQHDVEEKAVAAAKGDADLHDVALRLEQADISIRLLVKARNKAVEAYQEIMRMPV